MLDHRETAPTVFAFLIDEGTAMNVAGVEKRTVLQVFLEWTCERVISVGVQASAVFAPVQAMFEKSELLHNSTDDQKRPILSECGTHRRWPQTSSRP